MTEKPPTDVDTHEGQGGDITFEVEGKPDPVFNIRPTGDQSGPRYRYHWDERGDPAPECFDRVNHLEVKLVVGMTNWDGDVLDAADNAHDAIVNLKEAMCDQRDLDDEQRQEVALGNLDGLPEVERLTDATGGGGDD